MKMLIAYLFAAFVAVVWLSSYSLGVERATLERIKSGELILRCDFRDGTRDVAPEMVKENFEGTWLFADGGHAKSCILVVAKGGVL